ncbi:molybdopterin-containing oxidoreductase family protein [Leeia aquatica]|uniref:Molybdopterin oxidoreductase family protein n=1 Tax=Leeia aquatica TaxID=2725557 RepID=A0A847RRS3_9NEIS|nr:molybdopterin oxidoreductase family protein [Leeia aquatica]NLR73920.1 molybdopterin oxidoreductase family protein [Leeia aquatica]
MSQTIVQAACPHDCPDTCAMRITVEEGKVVRVAGDPDHPPTQGALCTKVSRYAERLYHPDRLLYPMKRVGRKGEGRFERISWDEALTTISQRLLAIAADNPQRILPYSYAGTMGLVQGNSMSARFFHKLGASQLDRTICASAGAAGLKHTYGASVGMDMSFVQEARLIWLWGTNSITSNLHYWTRVQEAKRRGARVVAIDPYRTLTADKCDEHVALLPGTDAALALGIMHVLIREDLLDHDYIRQYTEGFEALRERALDYPPARVAALCGIPQAQVERLAREYGELAVRQQQPVAIRLNYGMQRTRGGGQATRAVACLPSLVGAWRQRAGGMLMSTSGFFPIDNAALQRPDLMPDPQPRTINMSTIGDALTHPGGGDFGPRVDAVVVYNSNPVAVAPESGKVVAGFAREDLFTVVLEHFQTDTADYADILLPATMQMEHVDLHKSYGHSWLLANLPAVTPPGEARSNSDIFRQLAQYCGWQDACFQDADDALAAQALQPHAWTEGIQWSSLRAQGWQKLNLPDAPFAQGGFPTRSGKCQFYAEALAAEGLDPLPGFEPPHESPQRTPELAARYPLQMISPPSRHFLNTTFANQPGLWPKRGEPSVEMHPDDAAARALQHEQWVEVVNDRGCLQLRLEVSERVRPGVVVIPSIWWRKHAKDGKNANELTSQALTDLGAAPTFYDCLVEVRAAAVE